MSEKYEAPKVQVLGTVSDLTQSNKPGIYFDYPGAAEGNVHIPAPGTPGTGTS